MNIEKILKNLEKPSLSEMEKDRVKGRILSKLEIKESQQFSWAKEFKLDFVTRARIKERVFELIDERTQRSFFWYKMFVLQKKFVSVALVVMMFFGMFSFVSMDSSVVYAGTFTSLKAFEGNVSLLRAGVSIPIELGMELKKEDLLITGRNGSAEIKYFDESVSRLSNNTKVFISELNDVKENDLSYIEIEVVGGKVWSKVVNLVEYDSSFVVLAKDIYTRSSRAAFNIELEYNELNVEVFSDSVEIHRVVEENTKIANVVYGEKAVFQPSKDVEFADIEEKVLADVWVQENLIDDVVYVAELEGEVVAKDEGVLVADVLGENVVDSPERKTPLVFVTFDDVKKANIKLELLENELSEVKSKLEGNITDKDKNDLNVVLDDLNEALKNYDTLIKDIAVSDELYAIELENKLKDSLNSYKENLNFVALDEKEELVINDDVDDVVVADVKTVDPVVVVPSTIYIEDVSVGNYGVEIHGDKPVSPLLNVFDLKKTLESDID